MRIGLIAMTLALFGCGSAFPRTTNVRGTGTWTLQVENNNWLSAKVYLIPAYSLSGPRIATVTGLTRAEVRAPGRESFRLRVEFLASNEVWVSYIWGRAVCLQLTVMAYVPSTYIVPCRVEEQGT